MKQRLKDLAIGMGLRINHHNVGDLINMLRSYDREVEARILEKAISKRDHMTHSTWIGPFLDGVDEDELFLDPATPDGAEMLSKHIGGIPLVTRKVAAIDPGADDERATYVSDEYARLTPEKPREEVYEAPVRLNFAELQMQHLGWLNHNFPEQLKDPSRKDDSLLGLMEEVGELSHSILKIRQGIRGKAEDHIALAKDAVGDIVIFLTSLCTSYGWDLQECVETTWAQVRERDWKKYPDTGRPTQVTVSNIPSDSRVMLPDEPVKVEKTGVFNINLDLHRLSEEERGILARACVDVKDYHKLHEKSKEFGLGDSIRTSLGDGTVISFGTDSNGYKEAIVKVTNREIKSPSTVESSGHPYHPVNQ